LIPLHVTENEGWSCWLPFEECGTVISACRADPELTDMSGGIAVAAAPRRCWQSTPGEARGQIAGSNVSFEGCCTKSEKQ